MVTLTVIMPLHPPDDDAGDAERQQAKLDQAEPSVRSEHATSLSRRTSAHSVWIAVDAVAQRGGMASGQSKSRFSQQKMLGFVL
jgi:hypothetical protein